LLLTAEEAAQRLNIGRTQMFALIKSGEIVSVQIGRLRRIPLISIERYTDTLLANQNSNSIEFEE
jgi:excisionase family DNA binding protein